MVVPNVTIKFNIITVLGVVLLLGIALAAIGICFLNRGRLLESFDNAVNNNHYKLLQNNTGPELPLPEGKLFFFDNTVFSPKCCSQPQLYTSSGGGCSCLTEKQIRYLNQRGGNDTCGNDM